MSEPIIVPPAEVRSQYRGRRPQTPLVPAGTYASTIHSVEPYHSKNAQPGQPFKSVEVKAVCETPQGQQHLTALVAFASQTFNQLIQSIVPEVAQYGGTLPNLAGRRCTIRVTVRKGEMGERGQFPDKNEIDGIQPIQGAQVQNTQQFRPQAAPQGYGPPQGWQGQPQPAFNAPRGYAPQPGFAPQPQPSFQAPPGGHYQQQPGFNGNQGQQGFAQGGPPPQQGWQQPAQQQHAGFTPEGTNLPF